MEKHSLQNAANTDLISDAEHGFDKNGQFDSKITCPSTNSPGLHAFP
jgi:hypothetical protein